MDGERPPGLNPAHHRPPTPWDAPAEQPVPTAPVPAAPAPGSVPAPVPDVGGDAGATDEADPAAVADVPEPPQTGDAGVDEAVQLVAAAARGSLEEQVQAYESAHRTLQDRLADVES